MAKRHPGGAPQPHQGMELRAQLPGRRRPTSAVPLEKQTLRIAKSCAVCRDEPLIFHECPECTARYCGSGCLQSWYDHSKPSRAPPTEASVLDSELDFIVAELPTGESNEEVELSVTRAAGGQVLVDSTGGGKRRWSVRSVDGWDLGTPGPGPEWKPVKGVKVVLEELGCCRSCRAPLAVPEYICNSAARLGPRPLSACRRGIQHPRVKTFEVSTQTDVEFCDVGAQATPMTKDSAVEAVQPAGSALAKAQAAIAGCSLAELAAPAQSQDGTPQMLLTASLSVSSRRVRDSLSALAQALQGAAPQPSTWTERLRYAEVALKSLAGDNRGSKEAADSERVLGHRQEGAVPTFEAESGQGLQFKAGAAAILGGEALAALQRAAKSGPVPELPAATPPGLAAGRSEDGEAEALLLSKPATLQDPEASSGSTLRDVVANLAALLCTSQGADAVQALTALEAVAALLPSGARSIPPWRELAEAAQWPWPPGGSPLGWPLLQAALRALKQLADGPRGSGQGGPALDELLVAALEAVAKLGLFLDAEAVKLEQARAAAEKAAAERAAAEQAALAAQAQAAAPFGGLQGLQPLPGLQPLQPLQPLPGADGLQPLPGADGLQPLQSLLQPLQGADGVQPLQPLGGTGLGGVQPLQPFGPGGVQPLQPVSELQPAQVPEQAGLGEAFAFSAGGVPLNRPMFGKAATATVTGGGGLGGLGAGLGVPDGGASAPVGGGGQKGLQNAMQDLFKKKR